MIAVIDATNRTIGHGVAWLTLGMVLVQFTVVLLRYVFGVGMISLQEGIVWMHAIVFMLAAGYTLAADGHVRVDIFYREAAPRTKAMVDLAGVILFLWPVSGLILWMGWPFVMNSWAVGEASQETSGLPGLYLLKTVILVMPVLVMLQGLALALRSAFVLATGEEAE
jgi:TRAP-type mannitol/chloroaromatic compound transport system permease small subunit